MCRGRIEIGSRKNQSPPEKEDASPGGCAAPIALTTVWRFCFMNIEIASFYTRALLAVQQHVGIPDIFTSNKEESVDARTILVYILSSKGISDLEIARLTGLTRQCVNKLKNNCKYRKSKWSFSSNLQQISNELATNHL